MSSCCEMHGPASCIIMNVYYPLTGNNDVLTEYYSLIGHWKCKKCDRTGFELMKKIYDSTNIITRDTDKSEK